MADEARTYRKINFEVLVAFVYITKIIETGRVLQTVLIVGTEQAFHLPTFTGSISPWDQLVLLVKMDADEELTLTNAPFMMLGSSGRLDRRDFISIGSR